MSAPDDLLKNTYDPQLIRRMMTSLRPYRGLFIFSLLLYLPLNAAALLQPYLLVIFHPTTTEFGGERRQIDELLAALDRLEQPTVLFWPNIDAGADHLSKAIRQFRDQTKPGWLRTLINLPPDDYLRLLASAACAVGNSSSFVRDASYFGTPVVLVGNHEGYAVKHDDDAEDSDLLRWSAPLLAECAVWQELRGRIAKDGPDLHASRVVDGIHFVHASAGSPTKQYVWPGHEVQYVIFNRQIDERVTEFLDEFLAPHGFNGHTHVPAVLTRHRFHGVFDSYKGVDRHHVHTFVGPNAIFFVPRAPCRIEGLAEATASRLRASATSESSSEPAASAAPSSSSDIEGGETGHSCSW
jgi:hypothetical protein